MKAPNGNKISFAEKFGFGAFSCTYNLTYFFKSSYYLFFLTNVLGIGVAAAGTVVALGAVWDAINDPLIGYYSVNHPNSKGERIRNLIPLGLLPTSICLVLLFTNFHVSDAAALVISAVVFFIYDTFFTCLGTTYCTMATVATADQGERTSVNAHRSIGSSLGTVIGSLATFPIMYALGVMDEDGNLIAEFADRGFFIVACIFAVIAVAGSLIHYFTTEERVRPLDDEQKTGFWEMCRILFTYKPFVNITLMVMLYNIVILFMTTVVVYYATYITGSTGMSTYYQAAYIFGQLLCTIFLVKPVDNRLGHNRTLLLGLILFVIAKIPFAFMPSSSIAAFFNFGLSGIGAGFLYVIIFVQVSNVSDLLEWKSGRRMDAAVGSVSGFVCTIASAIVTEILALVLSATGFDAELAAQPASALSAINIMLGTAPLALAIVMVLMSKTVNLDSDMAQMQLERGEAPEA